MKNEELTVTHRPEGECFEAIVSGQRCVADYRKVGDVVRMTHTFVPASLEGRGIAAALVEAALNWAASENLKVEPLCGYVRAYMKRNGRQGVQVVKPV